MTDPLERIKEEATLFLDENVSARVGNKLKINGYKAYTVYDVGMIGANDGKLFRKIKEKRMVLITRDKRFSKMANKYGIITLLLNYPTYDTLSELTIKKRIQTELIHRYKEIKEYYEWK